MKGQRGRRGVPVITAPARDCGLFAAWPIRAEIRLHWRPRVEVQVTPVNRFQAGKKWLKRVVLLVVAVELAWLVLVNFLLFLPFTQTAINAIRPEKFYIEWEGAWSWYPGRVSVWNAMANGNSRSQMWQVEVGSVSGSIALLPLILKRVNVDGVSGADISFRLRPRLKPGRDYSRIEEWFPSIEGRRVTPAVTAPRKKKRPWRVSVGEIRGEGPLDYWIYHVRGQSEGWAEGGLSYVSPGGELELDVRAFDLALGRHTVGDEEMFGDGRLAGTMGFAPFVPRESKGLPMLGFLRLDVEVDIDANDLRFVRLFVLNFEQMRVDGEGRVRGRVRYDRGEVLDGTDLDIKARDLLVDVPGHRIGGKGDVDLARGPETDGSMTLDFRFRELQVTRNDADAPMLVGDELLFRVGGDGRVLPDPGSVNLSRSLSLDIQDLAVPDLSRLQAYLPEKWPLRLLGGDGRLGGGLALTPTSLSVDLGLRSGRARLALSNYRFETDLDAALHMENPAVMKQATHVAGSYIRLDDAQLLREGQENESGWNASLSLKEGDFHLLAAEDRAAGDYVLDLFRILGDNEFRGLLADSAGLFDFEAEVSSLAWISAFLGGQYGSDFHGSSTLVGTLALAAGLPAPGTDIDLWSPELEVRILDYVGRGDGVISLQVEEGGAAPDWRLCVGLANAEMSRHGAAAAQLHDVNLGLDALVEDVTLDGSGGKPFALNLDIESARVSDMSVFNRYLPPDSPLRFAGGQADLAADVVLRDDDADGWLRLDSRGIELLADGQSLEGDLQAELLLSGGVPAERRFEIAGSKLRLDGVRVVGEEAGFDDSHWSAELGLEAVLSISDSRPIVALFKNQDGWRPDFLARMMTLEDIAGTGTIRMANQRMVIPGAWLTSDNAEAGLKGVFSPEQRDGMLYFRYKKFDALLKVRDGKRNLDILNALRTFDAYEPPEP